MVDAKRDDVSRLISLIGEAGWRKRVAALQRGLEKSPFEAKIMVDYYWLEIVLAQLAAGADQDLVLEVRGPTDALAALYFASTVVEVHDRLTSRGRKALEGRLRASLQTEGGLAPIYVEMELTRQLWDGGFDVTFADLEGHEDFDLLFRNARVEGEIECKAISVDAGRKIHRKHFYRFIDSISRELQQRGESGADDVFVITLDDRLPSEEGAQRDLRKAFQQFMQDRAGTEVKGAFYRFTRELFSMRFPAVALASAESFNSRCRELYGANCHMNGAIAPDFSSAALVVMRSEREDDTSKPVLEALKQAANQFSGTRPSFIAVQLNDIGPADLLLEHLRWRMGLLSQHVFRDQNRSHVAATHFTAYGGLTTPGTRAGCPAFAVINPDAKFDHSAYAPFLVHVPDEDFAKLLLGKLPSNGP